MQKYSIPSGKSQPWRDFIPQTKNADSDQPVKNDSVFRYSPERTDGSIYWSAPMWSNRTAWDILNDYLNPVVNEMYTCLRINPSSSGKGKIQPTIMVREQPFSTGLFNWIKDPDREKLIQQATQGKKQEVRTKDKDPKSNKPRTFYCNLPRWIIDESIIKSLNVSTNEGQRVNFVQVWGTSVNAMTAGMPSNEINSAEVYRANQMNVGNWYVDSADVSRHGLRSDISESPYDFVRDGVFGTRTPIWARMRADWMFNGHLKY
ncbi:MAG: hypothetical protein HC902_14735, partial [Calothrix sp. SM1_5_4]|nr:hypothetical protein [Calothrix sp. SM1_5_4]